MGLVASPNKGSVQETPVPAAKSHVVELFDVPVSDGPSYKSRFPLSVENEKYMAKCMSVYGDDYTSMFRDIKVNDLQHTEEKLEKLGELYLSLTENQRRVAVPEDLEDKIRLTAGESHGD